MAVNNEPFKQSRFYANITPDPLVIDRKTAFPRKVYWFYKNYYLQKKIFRKIEQLRKEKNIDVLIGVFGGILPLVFYMNRKQRTAAVIFSDMDSWFVDVHHDMKKLWYRKYYSFNYALENADFVDFLSPFILDGIRERNIKLKEDSVVVAPCSFTDYSKCFVGEKKVFEISYASRIEPDKNPLLFLEAAKKIQPEFPLVKFHLLGEGTLVHQVENYIIANNLNSVVDFRFHPNPPEVFANSSVFVSLQSGTNYPSQSVLEAMACGNAVIAGNTGDTNLLINESNGLLIKLNVNELAGAMKKLITSPKLAASMGNSGRKFVLKHHTIEKMADYYVDLIEKVNYRVFLND